jgi:hypothetical protein
MSNYSTNFDMNQHEELVLEIEYLKLENKQLKQLIQLANNYLSGHGCGGDSVQRAAELWRKIHEETN